MTSFQIENVAADGMCLDTYARDPGLPVEKESCHYLGGNQVFMTSKAHEIRWDSLCLDANEVGKPVLLHQCHNLKGNQKWVYNQEVIVFFSPLNGKSDQH